MEKFNRPSMIFSDNPKLDTSGMAGTPLPMPEWDYKPPMMTTRDMVETHCANMGKKKGKGKGKGKGY